MLLKKKHFYEMKEFPLSRISLKKTKKEERLPFFLVWKKSRKSTASRNGTGFSFLSVSLIAEEYARPTPKNGNGVCQSSGKHFLTGTLDPSNRGKSFPTGFSY